MTADGQLNPEWVEWLMGWPIGWTDLKPLEMARFREWQQQHSIFLHNNPKQEGSMMDRLKQLAVQANEITCSGPIIHPACLRPIAC